ncbi:hypothetical protein DXV75_16890 [Alteromonas aestuariivivens]|uniref:Uncharacterized protein n=1 Tax=Alteromonas aestuariivivens TaxID=1938339 RepID=A0A3D8M2V0_9ALTE|nr:hypothetical protein DXV75_16890 [Alteromonas aestuariivivens]
MQAEEKVHWPDLSTIGYISGRAAVEEDINKGIAVFVLRSGQDIIGKPLKISLPQYAIHKDPESGQDTRVVIIQAEEANEQKVLGAYDFSQKSFMVGLLNEFTLLGSDASSR